MCLRVHLSLKPEGSKGEWGKSLTLRILSCLPQIVNFPIKTKLRLSLFALTTVSNDCGLLAEVKASSQSHTETS